MFFLCFPVKPCRRTYFRSRDQTECKQIAAMADEDGFVRGETLDLIFANLDDDILDEFFEEDIDKSLEEVRITIRILEILWIFFSQPIFL